MTKIIKTRPASQPTLCVAHILAFVTEFLADFPPSLFLYPHLHVQWVIMRHFSWKCFKVRQLLCCVLQNECIPSGLRCCLHGATLFAQLRRQRRSLMSLGVWVLMPSLQADTFKTIRISLNISKCLIEGMLKTFYLYFQSPPSMHSCICLCRIVVKHRITHTLIQCKETNTKELQIEIEVSKNHATLFFTHFSPQLSVRIESVSTTEHFILGHWCEKQSPEMHMFISIHWKKDHTWCGWEKWLAEGDESNRCKQ